MAKSLTKVFAVEVSKDSTEYQIDDFLGNILQYKIKDHWEYDYQNDLPNCRLEIVRIADDHDYQQMNLDFQKKWILIEKVN